MRKAINKLTLDQYTDAIEYGAGRIINFENFVLADGTDAEDNPRYLVLESVDGTPVNFEGDGAGVSIYELSLEDFHQLCTYYLLSLQPYGEQATITFRSELAAIKKFAK
jgi:hypothetical protein